MAKLYSNGIVFQDAINVQSALPVDDRLVLESVDDLCVANNTGTLYNVAYTGMSIVVMMDGTPHQFMLKDNSPYMNGATTAITTSNYTDYWLELGTSSSQQESLSWTILDD